MDDYVLLETHSRGFDNTHVATTVLKRTVKGSERLLVTQDPDRDSINDDDCVVLDENAQHALYLILKNRFE
jgi:hypothetical protein